MLFVVLGAAFGFALGMWSLLKLAKTPPLDGAPRRKDQQKNQENARKW